MNFRATLQLGTQTVAQLVCVNSDLLKQRSRYPVCLIEQRREKMLIRNFLVIGLRSEILRSLEPLLHFLRELVDAHTSPSAIARSASNAVPGKRIAPANIRR